MLSAPLRSKHVGCGEESVHFRFVEIADLRLAGSLDGNQVDLRPPVDVFRCMLADETGKGMNAAEPLVACAYRAMPLFLHVGQEQAHHLRGEIVHRQTVDPLVQLRGQIGQQQDEHVAVALLGVDGKVAFGHQMFDQESPDPGAQHG